MKGRSEHEWFPYIYIQEYISLNNMVLILTILSALKYMTYILALAYKLGYIKL